MFSECRNFPYDTHLFRVKSTDEEKSEFDELLQSLWKESLNKGHFRYKLENLETKILPGKYRFVAQLNEKRAIQRRKPQFISTISMPFNPETFNFLKLGKEEILFKLQPLHWKKGCEKGKRSEEKETINLLVINISPLEFGNCLLIPHVNHCLPQVLTADAMRLALEVMLISRDVSLRLGFNSLGAYASVNHLHFHLYYLQHHLLLENIAVKHLAGNCYEICDFPSKGFAFELLDNKVESTVSCIMNLAQFLVNKEISHNIFITRGIPFANSQDLSISSNGIYHAIRIFIWARKSSFGAKNDKAFNPALCELAGHLPIKSEDAFKTITEEKAAAVLSESCNDIFHEICNDVKHIFLD